MAFVIQASTLWAMMTANFEVLLRNSFFVSVSSQLPHLGVIAQIDYKAHVQCMPISRKISNGNLWDVSVDCGM